MHKTDPELVTVAEVEVGITELLQLLLCWGLERWAELAAAAAALATAEACTTLEVKAAAVAGAMDEVRAERCERITFVMCFCNSYTVFNSYAIYFTCQAWGDGGTIFETHQISKTYDATTFLYSEIFCLRV